MLFRTAITAFAMILAPGLALADPTGSYNVVGKNADTGETYEGTVEVTRTGATYSVIWTIGGAKSIGTGIGAHFTKDQIVMGPATPEDTGISVGYKTGDTFGIAMYFEQADGTWQGVWTYAGSQGVTREDWTRK
ncbi:hypothetical protein LJR030_001380 [Rhizobium sp. LjRoot30]|uniref:hypothetical protein n=1 Tax=Rhizobium sp. LjRoot30 TaxID=3342320 RepID=UPI003ED089B2